MNFVEMFPVYSMKGEKQIKYLHFKDYYYKQKIVGHFTVCLHKAKYLLTIS